MKFTKIFTGLLLAMMLFVTPAQAQRSQSADDPSGFVVLGEFIPDIIQEIRYYTTYNFVGEKIDGYEMPCALMTIEAAEALKKVSDDVMKMGYRLKIFDAYRPQMGVDHFMRWAANVNDTRMKKYFYPKIAKDRIIPEGYVAVKSGHSRGSTVDLTLFDMKTGKESTWAVRSIISAKNLTPIIKKLQRRSTRTE